MTSDQDWAPSWAAQSLLDCLNNFDVPTHFFRTNSCPVLDKAHKQSSITQGWHPNFRANSTHGKTPQAVLKTMEELFPSCSTIRSHCFHEDSEIWELLTDYDLIADSQIATNLQIGLIPLIHWSGLMRFPIYCEDDIYLHHFGPSLPFEPLAQTLLTPGLKIFNFHPSFFALNAPSKEYYDQVRGRFFQSLEPDENLIYHGRGCQTILIEILTYLQKNGSAFITFPELVEKTRSFLKDRPKSYPNF
jgi:polysaccharide deactylase WbmS-like protein